MKTPGVVALVGMLLAAVGAGAIYWPLAPLVIGLILLVDSWRTK